MKTELIRVANLKTLSNSHAVFATPLGERTATDKALLKRISAVEQRGGVWAIEVDENNNVVNATLDPLQIDAGKHFASTSVNRVV